MPVPFEFDESAYNFSAAAEVLPLVIGRLHPSSILDVGCGLGTWLKVAKDFGIKEVFGVDGAIGNKEQLKIVPDEFSERDLREPLNLSRKFDLVLCLEVAEHLPSERAEILIQSLCKHGDVILFSAAIPGQGGQNHINEQWPEYWAELFKGNGFNCYDVLRPVFWNNDKVDFWYRQNLMLYSRKEIPGHDAQSNFRLNALVHPELLKGKERKIEMLKGRIQFLESRNPGVRESLKNLTRALKKKFFG